MIKYQKNVPFLADAFITNFEIKNHGRDLKHLINTVDARKRRDIGFKVPGDPGAQIDTTTTYGRLCFGIFAALAEFERQLIAERSRAGLATARARRRKSGRHKKDDRRHTFKMAMNVMADPQFVAANVTKRLSISTYTYVMEKGR